jgi:hypothetical protein
MFNLNKIITTFNQKHHTRIKSNKTWGLLYLQPKMLAILKKSTSLIYDSEGYASPFSTQRRAIQIDIARIKAGLVTDRLPTLRTVTQQLVTDHPISQRLDWEEHFKNICNTESLWEQSLKRMENTPVIKRQFEQLYSQWQIHHAFQRHSSQGLLFLLDGIMHYKQHFIRALQELHNTKRTRFTFQRLPDFVAEPYLNFLDQQLYELERLQPKVLEALLLRLKAAEHYKQVSCDDVSYALAEQVKNLNLAMSVPLPTTRHTHLNATTFNQCQRAIERYGDESQKQQLYQLMWYQRAKKDPTCDITTIQLAQHHLLIPKTLVNSLPVLKKSTWLFPNQTDYLPFLETQQALLAQLALPISPVNLLEKVSLTHPQLQSTITRYQLLQHALAQPLTVHWWQWQKKQYKKHWQRWLEHQLQKTQADVWTGLNSLQHDLYYRTELLAQPGYRQHLQTSVAHFKFLADNDLPAYRSPALTSMFESLSLLFKEKETESTNQTCRAARLIQCFKQDLALALENYLHRYNSQGFTFSVNHALELCNLLQSLQDTKDIVQLRELFIQRYQAMTRFQFIKLFAATPNKIFQRELQTVLENPNYSVEELKRAADTLAPGQSTLALHDAENTSAVEKQKAQPSMQTAHNAAYSFFKPIKPDKTIDFFTKVQTLRK